ncbi:MAG: sprT domain-containing protein [Bacteroidetes bacterium]|nr:sprT domain-containing protein [Bacteroidota bacterium]
MDLRAQQYVKNSEILKKYLPEKTVPIIANWIVEFNFKLKITKERRTRLGDYTSPRNGLNHVITINHNLNCYSFLITLVHEVAHLKTYNEYKNKVLPHGQEWKNNFKLLMRGFLTTEIFPLEIYSALKNYMENPAASTCSDTRLLWALKLNDEDDDSIFIIKVPFGAKFIYNENRIFIKGSQNRKLFKCKEIATGLTYLFNPLTQVKLIENELASNFY